MRILKTFIVSIIVIAIFGGLSFLAAREILLLTALSRIKQSLTQVREADQNQTYLTDCMNRGASRDERGRIHHTQLRYIDKNSYVLEVVCNGMEHNPIEFGQGELPKLVEHQAGQSGMRWGENAGLNFICLDRVGSLSVIEGIYKTSLKPSVVLNFTGPVSACESYGYQCCDQSTQVGEGELVVAALDCPQTCHVECLERPLILSFNTQPYYNRINRTLEVKRNTTVIFSYMVAPNQDASFIFYEETDDPVESLIIMVESFFVKKAEEEALNVILDYGDGDSDEFSGLRGQVQHVYQCNKSECDFEASIKVVKENGVESLDAIQNKILIKVKG